MKERLGIGDLRLDVAHGEPRSPEIHPRTAGEHCHPGSMCTVCSDEVQHATVLRVDGERLMAETRLDGRDVEIDISLVSAVQEGDVLLVHGGVALEREGRG